MGYLMIQSTLSQQKPLYTSTTRHFRGCAHSWEGTHSRKYGNVNKIVLLITFMFETLK